MKTRTMNAALAALLFFAVTSTSACAQEKAASEDMTGIKVGEKAPDFELKAQDGKTYKLSEVAKKGTVALVFFRSADW